MLDLLDPAFYYLNVCRMHVDDGSPDLVDTFVEARGRDGTFSELIAALLAFGNSGERLAPGHVFGIDRHPPGARVSGGDHTPSAASTHFAYHSLPDRLRRPDMRRK